MTASIVARIVRMPMLAAVVASALAACSNDPLSPTAPRSRVSGSVSAAPAEAGANTTASDGSVPWFRTSTASTTASDGSVPWFRTTPADSATTTSSDGSVPWF